MVSNTGVYLIEASVAVFVCGTSACVRSELFSLQAYPEVARERREPAAGPEALDCPPARLNLRARDDLQRIRHDALPVSSVESRVLGPVATSPDHDRLFDREMIWVKLNSASDMDGIIDKLLAIASSDELLTKDLQEPCLGELCWTISLAQESCVPLLVKCAVYTISGVQGAPHCSPVAILDPEPEILMVTERKRYPPEGGGIERDVRFRQPRVTCNEVLAVADRALRADPLRFAVKVVPGSYVRANAFRRPSPILSRKARTIWETVSLNVSCYQHTDGSVEVDLLSNLLINEQNTTEHYDWHEAPASIENEYANTIIKYIIIESSTLCKPPRPPVVEQGNVYRCP
jgi:hypothetical protein